MENKNIQPNEEIVKLTDEETEQVSGGFEPSEVKQLETGKPVVN